jgi:hypothetical protein
MIQRRTGELRVQAQGKYGSIYFIDGKIEDAMSGSAIGAKALFRILSWDQSHWKLNLNQHTEYDGPSLNMELSEFLHKTEIWLKDMQKIVAKSPPPNIRIAIEGKNFYNRPAWNANEVQVLASLASSEKVFEVLNSCPLEDHLILETLINFRKQNIINVLV